MAKKSGKFSGGDDQLLKIRITLTSVDVKRLEKGGSSKLVRLFVVFSTVLFVCSLC